MLCREQKDFKDRLELLVYQEEKYVRCDLPMMYDNCMMMLFSLYAGL